MKTLFFLLLSFQMFAQHYSNMVVYVDKKIVGDHKVDVYFRLGEPNTYIFYEDDVFKYDAQIDTTDGIIMVLTKEFLIITDESKEIIILNKEVDGENVELVYHNNE